MGISKIGFPQNTVYRTRIQTSETLPVTLQASKYGEFSFDISADDGITPLGIVGWGCNETSQTFIHDFYMDPNGLTAKLYLKNPYNTDVSITSLWIDMLYTKIGLDMSEVTVIDNLTTDSGLDALSARQGKVLSEEIDNKVALNECTTLSSSSASLDTMIGNDYAGVYYLQSGVPGSVQDWAMLLVLAKGNLTSQLIIGSKTWFRIYVGNPATWTDWRRVMNSLPETFTSEGIIAKKIDNIVQIKVATSTTTYDSSGWKTLATLPVQYRSANEIYTAAYENGSYSFADNKAIDMRVTTGGEVQIYVFSDKKTIAARGNITYITNYYTG